MESTHVTKENSATSCETKGGDNLSVEKITGVDGQTAALYLVPHGAEVEGSPMNACWANYMNLANGYVNNVEYFQFVSFDTQQGYNEEDIRRESPPTEEIITLYREFYNQKITDFRRTHSATDLEDALEHLANFNKERREREGAANKIQQWYCVRLSDTGTYIADEPPLCGQCDAPATVSGLCADCYWEEDQRIKDTRRIRRQGAL
jgi:hypothetical protein